MDGGIVQPFRTTRENTALTSAISVNLKFVEVGVLLVAGILFVAWQFRDLQRAKEITRLNTDIDGWKELYFANLDELEQLQQDVIGYRAVISYLQAQLDGIAV